MAGLAAFATPEVRNWLGLKRDEQSPIVVNYNTNNVSNSSRAADNSKVLKSSAATPATPATLHEFRVIFHEGTKIPDFLVNHKAAVPVRYESGIATFSLAAGAYLIQATYPDQTCSTQITVPISELIPADCNPR